MLPSTQLYAFKQIDDENYTCTAKQMSLEIQDQILRKITEKILLKEKKFLIEYPCLLMLKRSKEIRYN